MDSATEQKQLFVSETEDACISGVPVSSRLVGSEVDGLSIKAERAEVQRHCFVYCGNTLAADPKQNQISFFGLYSVCDFF